MASGDPLRDALFAPCTSKAELRDWLLCYLGIDFPDSVVSADSTISPMGLIWLIYDIFRTRKFHPADAKSYKDFGQIMAYASRSSYKTLAVAASEVAVLFHIGVDIIHLAAIEEQSKKAQSYVKDAVERPYLCDFVTLQNERTIKIARYTHRRTGQILTPREWKAAGGGAADFVKVAPSIQIVVCTVKSTNGQHAPYLVVDEIDVVSDIRAYNQAKLIPDSSKGVQALTVSISTRKSSAGLVQKELDEAAETGLKVEHWNVVDVTQACPPERHLPDEPRIPIYRAYPDGKNRGAALAEADFLQLSEKRRKDFARDEGYAGCLKNCRLFFACHGRLATAQTDPSRLLKPIDDVTQNFRKVTPGMANAELLCRKPSDEGLVYPAYDRDIHMISAAKMAEMVTGDEYPETLAKGDLVKLFVEHGLEFCSGLDHGHTHNFAVATAAKNVNKIFIFDVQSSPGLELDHKVALMDDSAAGQLSPRIWPDTSEPGSNKTIKRKGRKGKGYDVRYWKKGPDSVHLGIGIFQAKLRPALGEPEVYLLRDDPGCELLGFRISRYSWGVDAAGRLTAEPVKVDDDELDAARYLLMNEFPPRGKPVGAVPDDPVAALPPPSAQPTEANYLSHFIQEHLGQGEDPSYDDSPEAVPKPSGGKVFWEF